jgi:hypothetical protein
MARGVVEASGQAETGATALSALDHFLDGPQIDRRRRVLGLRSSGSSIGSKAPGS